MPTTKARNETESLSLQPNITLKDDPEPTMKDQRRNVTSIPLTTVTAKNETLSKPELPAKYVNSTTVE